MKNGLPRPRRFPLGYLICLAISLCPSYALSQNYAVVVGHNIGHLTDDPLRYAERDAERFWELLISIGEVKKRDSYLLLAPTTSQVHKTLDDLNALLSSEENSRRSASVVFYYAGHGDHQALHLAKESLERDTLVHRLKSLNARVKLVILDACQTPAVTQRRGVRGGASFAVTISNTSVPKGVVIIQSSQVGAPALESDALGGSLFSHYWLSALRGAADKDRDGVVTLQEAYLFTSRQTYLYSSGSANTVQQPSFNIDLEGAYDLVLTRLSKANSKLVIVDDEDASYMVFQQASGAFVAEAHPIPKLPLEIAVPAGRLLIHRRSGVNLRVAQIETAMSGRYTLVPSDFIDRPYEQLVRRGGTLILYPNKLAVRYALQGDYLSGLWIIRHGPRLEYEYEIDNWSLKSELGFSFASYRSGLFLTDEAAIGGWFSLQRNHPFEAILLSLGFGPTVRWIYQQRQRLDADRLAKVGIDSDASSVRWTISPGIHCDLGWSASLSKSLYLIQSVRGSLSALLLRNTTEESWYAVWTLEGTLGIGYRF